MCARGRSAGRGGPSSHLQARPRVSRRPETYKKATVFEPHGHPLAAAWPPSHRQPGRPARARCPRSLDPAALSINSRETTGPRVSAAVWRRPRAGAFRSRLPRQIQRGRAVRGRERGRQISAGVNRCAGRRSGRPWCWLSVDLGFLVPS